MQFYKANSTTRITLWALTLLLGCLSSVFAGEVTVTWDPKTDSGLTGYKLHYGTASRSYSQLVNVGNTNTYTLTGLGVGTYYVAVTAYYSTGSETAYSNEVSVSITSPVQPPSSGSLAHSGTMTANSQNFHAEHAVEHLWNGCSDSTPACTTGNDGITSFWVEFDFANNYNLTSARLFGDADGTWVSQNWKLEYKRNSTDAWSSAFSGINAFANGWSTQSLAVTARYVRVTVLGTTATQARELEIYGTPVGSTGSPLPAPTNVSVK